MQTVLQVEPAVPLHDVREQVAVEGGVLGEQPVEGELALGRDELVDPDRPWRDLRPLLQRETVVGLRTPFPNRFEDHDGRLPSHVAVPLNPCRPHASLATGADTSVCSLVNPFTATWGHHAAQDLSYVARPDQWP